MAGAIFSGNINALCTAWMMIGMLVFAVVWESGTGWIERKLAGNKAHSEMLSKVYKELMILGFIAFALIMGKEVGAVDWGPETLHCFEFCDLLVSICVLLYVANTAISSLAMHVTQREWDRMAMKPVATVMDDVTVYLDGLQSSGYKRLKHFLPFVASEWRDEADFKILQLLFKTKFHLHPNFDYVMYVKSVLEDNVVAMANVSTWHWLLIMIINAIWLGGMLYLMPLVGLETTIDPKTCGVFCDDEDAVDSGGGSRRRLASGPIEPCQVKIACNANVFNNSTELETQFDELRGGENGTAGYNDRCAMCEAGRVPVDISPEGTLWSIVLFGLIGWTVLLLQALMLRNVNGRMMHIITLHGADEDSQVNELLERLQKNLIEHAQTQSTPEDADSFGEVDEENESGSGGQPSALNAGVISDEIVLSTSSKLHHTHIVDISGDADDAETDHIMTFKSSGKNSNSIMSLKNFETLMFLTQFFQLVMDFYFGFYVVHMIQRVPKVYIADGLFDSNTFEQLVLHLFLFLPVFLMLYVLMMMTRKMSLLIGVLHLKDEAVAEVLEHMELVKTIRRRITDCLTKTKVVRGKPKPKDAEAMLEKAERGEVAILLELAEKENFESARVTRKEMRHMMKAKKEDMTLTLEDLDVFLDRAAYRAYLLESEVDKKTHQQARTLELGPGDDQARKSNEHDNADSILVSEFSGLLVRQVADILNHALELSPKKGVVKAFKTKLTDLDSVDNDRLEYCRQLARCKGVFRQVDRDNSGDIERNELYGGLRRYKVPITRDEFKHIFRVIDPDQSRTMSMDEWIDFMMATEDDLAIHTQESSMAEQKANAEKGDGIAVFAEEGVGVLFGDRAGKMVGKTVGRAVDISDKAVGGTLGVVGLREHHGDTASRSAGDVHKNPLAESPGSDDLEEAQAPQREGATRGVQPEPEPEAES